MFIWVHLYANRVTSMIYPDSSVGTDLVKKSYYVDGNYKTITDQRNVVHTYGYNVRRQQKLDSVSIPEAR